MPNNFFLDYMNDFGMHPPPTTSTFFDELVNQLKFWSWPRKLFFPLRLPNRPQTRVGGAHSFNEAIQLDLFNFEGLWFMIMLDEATPFKTCSVVEGQEAEQLLDCLFKSWIYMFGPPAWTSR